MKESFRFFVGVDWAKEEHAVCVIDAARQIIEQCKIAHSGAGMAELADRLGHLGEPAEVAVAIEMPRGAVVESLLERGFAVFSLNPKQMDRFRDRHTMAGAKDDSRDAFVMADALRTDQPLFRRVRLDDPVILRLRELSRLEQEVQRDQARARNRLCELLNRYYPQMLELCSSGDEPWIWDLLEKASLPARGARMSAAKIQTVLRAHRIRRLNAEAIQTALQKPALPLAPGAAEAASEHVLLLLPVLRLLHKQRQAIAQRMESLLQEMAEAPDSVGHRDAKILLSLPGVGRVVGATMLAEAGQALAERDYHALRSYAGVAPVTRQSGKRKIVVMRQGCNPRLRNALYHWARVSTLHDPRSRQRYAALRTKGHSHSRALRGLADRLLAILVAMLRSGTLFDSNHRVAVQPAA